LVYFVVEGLWCVFLCYSDKMKSKKLWLILSLVLGGVLFTFFVVQLGKTAIELLTQNFDLKYFIVYVFFTLFAFFPVTWRLQVILKGYDKKVNFWSLLKQTIAAYSVSYVTPAARVGGEPLRAYMLKKESGVDLKTGSSAIIIDKFVEFFGSFVLGVIGLIAILLVPGFAWEIKLVFIVALSLAAILTVGFYLRTINGKGSLSTMFQLARLHKVTKWKDFHLALIDVEKLMEKFFKEHKKSLVKSGLFYLMTGVTFFLELKFLLLSFGVNVSLIDLVFIVNLWGIVNFVPVPAGIGFLEAGQATLFHLLQGDGAIGLAMALVIRARSLLAVTVGFLLITQFSGKQVLKEFKTKVKEQEI